MMINQKVFFICMFFVMPAIPVSELKKSVPFYKNRKIQFASGALLTINVFYLRYLYKKYCKKISFLEEIAEQTGVAIHKIENKDDFSAMKSVKIDSSGYEYFFQKLTECCARNLIVENNSFIKVPVEELKETIDSAFDEKNFFIPKNGQYINVDFYTYLQYWYRSPDQKKNNINIESVFFFKDLKDATKVVCAYALQMSDINQELTVRQMLEDDGVFAKGVEQKRGL